MLVGILRMCGEYKLKTSEDSTNEDDKKESEILENNKQEGGNIEENVESENSNDIIFNVHLGEFKRNESEYSKFSLKENGKIKDTFAPYIKENNDDIQKEVVEVSDEIEEGKEQSVSDEASNKDVVNEVDKIEDDTSSDTEKNGLGAVIIGIIIIMLSVAFLYSRGRKRQN